MKAFGGLLTAVALCLWVSFGWAAQAQTMKLEGFDLGMSISEVEKIIAPRKLTEVYKSDEIPGRLSISYKGHVLDNEGGSLDLVFRDGKLILITAGISGTTPEQQQAIAQKHQELDDAIVKAYGNRTETAGPDMQNWVFESRVISLFKGTSKMFISIFDREALSE